MISFRALTQYIQPQSLSNLTGLLFTKMQSGHVCLDLNDCISNDELHDDTRNYAKNFIQNPEAHFNEWIGENPEKHPIIFNNNKLFLQRFFLYEKSIIQKITELISNENIDKKAEDLKKALLKIPTQFSSKEENIDWQWMACLCGFLNNFTIITGGPGTGKTSTVNKLIYLMLVDDPELKINIVAPTGKAASRLKESQLNLANNAPEYYDKSIVNLITQIPCSTIHSLLGYLPNSIHFKHNSTLPLDTDVLIIDESSMIDLQLFYKLFQAINPQRTKVIMLGDRHQLASVEMGNVFGELCKSINDKNILSIIYHNKIQEFFPNNSLPYFESQKYSLIQDHVIELVKSYRFKDDAGIGMLSKAVLSEDIDLIEKIWNFPPPELNTFTEIDYTFLASEFLKEDAYFYTNDIKDALNKINNFKILSTQNEGSNGVAEINNHIESELQKRGVIKKTGRFYNNQIILITKNQPELQIYNGDIGLIRERIVNNEKTLLAYFDDPIHGFKTVIPLEILSFSTAYCMTIHKSQGSEFNHVALVFPNNDIEHLLNKEILYTGLTRAKEKLTIFGQLDLIKTISKRTSTRYSGISDHIKNS